MEIECEFSRCLSGYRCRVSKASITKPNVDIASFKGNHQPGKSNDDITEVIFDNERIEYFPRNLQQISPRLKTLRINSCGLKQISRKDLVGLEKLVCLNLDRNQLKSLPDDLFSNMPSLKQVFLTRNKIEFASSKLIEPIVGNQLKCFELNGNTNIDEYYWPALKSGCKSIQELMSKIDRKCKPPSSQTSAQSISKTAQCGSFCEAAEEIFKGFTEHRLLGRFTDFVIAVGSKGFPVHKIVLATQSPVLAEMFEVKNDGRSASKLEISDLSAEAVEAFLDYLYKRKLPDPQNAMEIFQLAAKFEVAQLRTICEGIIQGNLDDLINIPSELNGFWTF